MALLDGKPGWNRRRRVPPLEGVLSIHDDGHDLPGGDLSQGVELGELRGTGRKNDQAWVSRSRYQTRVREPFSMRSSKGLFRRPSDDVRDFQEGGYADASATRAHPHFHGVGTGSELRH